MEATKSVLECYIVTEDEEGEIISEHITYLLPTDESFSATKYFSEPCFPITVLGHVAEIYGDLYIPNDLMTNLGPDARTYKTLMDHNWIAYALRLLISSINDIAIAYRRHNDLKCFENLEKDVHDVLIGRETYPITTGKTSENDFDLINVRTERTGHKILNVQDTDHKGNYHSPQELSSGIMRNTLPNKDNHNRSPLHRDPMPT